MRVWSKQDTGRHGRAAVTTLSKASSLAATSSVGTAAARIVPALPGLHASASFVIAKVLELLMRPGADFETNSTVCILFVLTPLSSWPHG